MNLFLSHDKNNKWYEQEGTNIAIFDLFFFLSLICLLSKYHLWFRSRIMKVHICCELILSDVDKNLQPAAIVVAEC